MIDTVDILHLPLRTLVVQLNEASLVLVQLDLRRLTLHLPLQVEYVPVDLGDPLRHALQLVRQLLDLVALGAVRRLLKFINWRRTV